MPAPVRRTGIIPTFAVSGPAIFGGVQIAIILIATITITGQWALAGRLGHHFSQNRVLFKNYS